MVKIDGIDWEVIDYGEQPKSTLSVMVKYEDRNHGLVIYIGGKLMRGFYSIQSVMDYLAFMGDSMNVDMIVTYSLAALRYAGHNMEETQGDEFSVQETNIGLIL